MIYFFRRKIDGAVKIGVTIDYHKRVRQLTLKHGELELLGLMDGSYKVEQALHKQFAEYRSNEQEREWFKDVPALREYIQTHACLNIPSNAFGQVRVSATTQRMIRQYAGILQRQSGKRITDDDALRDLFERFLPDIVNREKAMSGQNYS